MRTHALAALPLALLTLATPRHARAQSADGAQTIDPITIAPPAAAPRAVAGDRGPRVRFGFGGALGIAVGGHSVGGGVFGGQMDVGLQFNDRFALYVRGEATTLLVTGSVGAALLFEYTPVPSFSIAAGPATDAYLQLSFFGSAPSESDFGGMLLFAYNALHRLPSGYRQGFRATLGLTVGATGPNDEGPSGGVSTMVGIGYVIM